MMTDTYIFDNGGDPRLKEILISAINLLQIKEEEMNALPHGIFIFTWQSRYSQKWLPGISSVHNNYGYISEHNSLAIFSESRGNKYLLTVFQMKILYEYQISLYFPNNIVSLKVISSRSTNIFQRGKWGQDVTYCS